MKKLLLLLGLTAALATSSVIAQDAATPAPAATEAAATPEAPKPGSIEELDLRLQDIEAYMNNGARVNTSSKVAGPGPGEDASALENRL